MIGRTLHVERLCNPIGSVDISLQMPWNNISALTLVHLSNPLRYSQQANIELWQ